MATLSSVLCSTVYNSQDLEATLMSINRGMNKEDVVYMRKKKVKVAQLYPTLCDLMDYTVHGILQARILKWVAFPLSRGSSQPRDQTQVSHMAGRFFTS